jgi:hypothetical protein
MPESNPNEMMRTRPENSPVAWFSELLIAIDHGEYHRASEAQDQLARLGWSVAPHKPSEQAHKLRHAARGRRLAR